MTYAPVAAPAPMQAPKRPVVLIVLQFFAGLSGLLPIVAGILNFAGGRRLAEEELVNNINRIEPALMDEAGLSEDSFVELMRSTGQWEGFVADFQGAMATWAGIEIGFGVLLLVWTVFARMIWARVLLTVFSVLAFIVHFAAIGTSAMGSDVVGGLLVAAWPCGLLTLIFCWLPPINRYARALKLAR
ncbi:hypothetical protein SAMN02982929_00812 [Saccharopolyspora kobensis]|uniref:Uncharacterized protein n=1 Tax=Saccharopolyspora kobensis TaxID=146035 RepID=A0A1H5V9P1_9PSEU|nr:hypothetical protein [Saccharopolyspora kobensis]SEF83933.1 hypothetical protein SAMN02982929_00812 [Saccharopolyspora kobensis]SFC63467.1 hypothetical protein SAMN05216506_1011258 [Saccharopolyspora kobensis]